MLFRVFKEAIMPLVLLFIALSLSACNSSIQKSPHVQSPAKPILAHQLTNLDPDGWKYKIIELANEEWVFFGQQKVVIDGDEESIPHVGTWEDDDYVHSERIRDYWKAVDVAELSGEDCDQPWSAAFISWIMQQAGIPASLFPRAIAHKTYVSYFLAHGQEPDALFIPHTIQDYAPKPGDLICARRGKGYFQVEQTLPQTVETPLHCDIVVQVNNTTLQAIGGNVRNSVSKTMIHLDEWGHIQWNTRRPWFLIIENRLNG
jgi:hypothetical protein